MSQENGRPSRKRRLSDTPSEPSYFDKEERQLNENSPDPPQLHPLLRDMAALPKASNPLRRQKVRSNFDATSLNPYLSALAALAPAHKPRPLHINPKGKYVAEGERQRAKLEADRAQQAVLAEKEKKGILPDINTQENLYKPRMPPLIEWWDRPFLQTRLYREFRDSGKAYVKDSEDAPVSVYIQHPVPISAPWERDAAAPTAKVYLTKKETKRKRRNERQARHQEAQDRIRLGLDPPPPPKIKLSNLMNVLTNEAIKDPTGVEMRVREEVRERHEAHMLRNEQRKATPEQRHEKAAAAYERNLAKGIHTAVYKVGTLSDKQHFFKVDMNAKQLNLVGVALVNPRFCLVIVEGAAKSIRYFHKLMTHRIDWLKLVANEDLSKNTCTVVWEGELPQLSFGKWSPMYTKDDDEAYKVLNKFGHENYWRQASGM